MIDVGQGVTVIFEMAGGGGGGLVVGGVDGLVGEFPEHAAMNRQTPMIRRFMDQSFRNPKASTQAQIATPAT